MSAPTVPALILERLSDGAPHSLADLTEHVLRERPATPRPSVRGRLYGLRDADRVKQAPDGTWKLTEAAP